MLYASINVTTMPGMIQTFLFGFGNKRLLLLKPEVHKRKWLNLTN